MTERVTPDLLRRMKLPEPGGGGKEERGRVLVVAGSREVPGAAILAGTAVLRVGAGKLQFQSPQSIALGLGLSVPEAMSVGLPETGSGSISPDAADTIVKAASRCAAFLIGPGLVNDDSTAELVSRLLARIEGCPILLDAAAMMRLRDHADLLVRHAGRIVVTPHAGEMAGILKVDKDEIERDPEAVAREAAARFGIVVVLKGACTYVAAPRQDALFCDHGNPGLGTSGSGDTLAGFITGFMGRGAEPLHAALWGVYLHGEAGNRLARARGPLGFLAREIPDEAPAILADLCGAAS